MWKFKHIVQTAHFLKKNYGFNFSDSMKKSWLFFKIRNKMKTGIVNFSYIKDNGEIRKANGTHCFNNIPKNKWPSKNSFYYLNLIRYFDIDSNGWRSFTVDKINIE